MTADLQKNVVFGLFTLLLFLQPNEWIITFKVYSLIWLQNQQKSEKSKNDIFLQVRGHRKLQFFWIFQKPLKWQEIIIIWHQDT